MAFKHLNNVPKKTEKFQFKFECMSFTALKKTGHSISKLKTCASDFDNGTSQAMRKVMKIYNTRVIKLLLFYDIRQSLVYKVLGVVMYES